MYDLNYTFLTELEVDTRQSFDDLSDDLLLLDKNAEESQVVDMKSVISSWQNYFWKSPNANKQRLDITFTDISIYRGSVASTDYQGNPLNDLEMMSVEELNSFFHNLDDISAWAGGRTWAQLSNVLCNAIGTLQDKYTTKDNIYPNHSVVITDEDLNSSGFGTWTRRDNRYLSEVFSKSNYDINPGDNPGSGSISEIGLTNKASSPPSHTHKISYIPASGNGGSSSEGTVSEGLLTWSNARRGLDPTYIGSVTSQTSSKAPRYKYSGKPYNSKWHETATVKGDANSTVGAEGGAKAEFNVSKTKVDPVDNKIKVAPKTYPLSATIWERTD